MASAVASCYVHPSTNMMSAASALAPHGLRVVVTPGQPIQLVPVKSLADAVSHAVFCAAKAAHGSTVRITVREPQYVMPAIMLFMRTWNGLGLTAHLTGPRIDAFSDKHRRCTVLFVPEMSTHSDMLHTMSALLVALVCAPLQTRLSIAKTMKDRQQTLADVHAALAGPLALLAGLIWIDQHGVRAHNGNMLIIE